MYVEENQRYRELLNRGKVFLSIITLYLGILFYKSSDLLSNTTLSKEEATDSFLVFFIASSVSFIFSLLFCLISLGILTYQYPSNPTELLEEFESKNQTDLEFFRNRTVDFTIAFEHNKKKNDSRGKYLRYTSGFIFMGILLHLFYIVLNF